MASVVMTCREFECAGGCSSSAASNDVKEESICFPKATEGSCSSQSSYLTADSSNQGHDSDSDSDSEIDQVLHSRRVSSVVVTDCVVDIENGVDEVRISLGTMERECRICMLSLDSESGIAIELGCSCKNELAAAHQHCAEQWFKSKGNKICEICKSIAQNIVIPNDIESREQGFSGNRYVTNAVPIPASARNTFSTNAVPVPVFEHNTFSTNSISVTINELDSNSTNAVSVPISSTPQNCERLVSDISYIIFLGLSTVLILSMFVEGAYSYATA